MTKELIPANDRIVVKPVDEGETMYGSIVVPDMGKEKPEMGTVVAIGPGRLSEFGKMIPVRSCKEGDLVIIPKLGTLRIDFEDEEYLIVQDREVLAVVKETELTELQKTLLEEVEPKKDEIDE
jgi:chaperonin GroES|tara:strand:+ start:105 stop:473 length:369 start_codon:yes stop_codon:yes gene_type:complete